MENQEENPINFENRIDISPVIKQFEDIRTDLSKVIKYNSDLRQSLNI